MIPIFVINLKKRPDRLEAFRQRQKELGWGLSEVEIVEGIDGSLLDLPKGFKSGNGAYGCLLSHCKVLEMAIVRKLDSFLVLEDDVIWKPVLVDSLAKFMKDVPSWDALMLGGQHRKAYIDVSPGIAKVIAANRTHAVAIKAGSFLPLLEVWKNANQHIDIAFFQWQRSHNVFAPVPFLFGQCKGTSDIGENLIQDEYWNNTPLQVEPKKIRAPRKLVKRDYVVRPRGV
jgi:hypothetical protein